MTSPSQAARYLLAVTSGVLHYLSFAGSDQWWLSFVCLVPLLLALQGASPRQALALGVAFGLVYNLAGYHWLVGMLREFSGFPIAVCLFFYVVLCLYQGGLLAVFAGLQYALRRRGARTVLAVPAGLVVAERFYPMLFPSYLGASLHPVPVLIQTADLGGPLLLSALVAVANTLVFELVRTRRATRDLALAAAALALALGYGVVRIRQVDARAAAAPRLRVGIVQSDMGAVEKQQDPLEGIRRHLQQTVELERSERPDLIVWPESAFNLFLPRGTTNLSAFVTEGRLHTPLLFGALRRDGAGDYNTAALLDARGELRGTYDKTYLLMFGEYLPFGETFPRLYSWSPETSRFTPGSHLRPLELGPWRISTLICYEDILPRFVRAAVGAADPHLLVNLTNDAWFGNSREPWIHLALASLRAVEHRRYLVRSTNTGVSAIVDPVGRVTVHGGVFTRESLVGEVRMLTGRTVYARIGDALGWAALAWVALVLVPSRRPRCGGVI